MKRKKLYLLIVACLLGFGLTALTYSCGEKLERTARDAEKNNDVPGVPTPTADTSTSPPPTKDVKAQAGPQRLIVLSPAAVEVIFALGAGDRIVGSTRYAVYPPEARDLPDVGGVKDINYERLVTLKPDMILAQTRNEQLADFAQQRGIRLNQLVIESVSDLLFAVRRIGLYLNLRQKGRELAQKIEAELLRVRKRVSGHDPIPCFITIDRRPGQLSGLMTAGRGTFVNELVELAGGKNIFDDVEVLYPTVSKESLLTREPAVLLEFKPGSNPESPEMKSLVADWDSVKGLLAARMGRIEIVTHGAALMPGPRIAEVADAIVDALQGKNK
jgi:ABC-type Fe3+-hydroxamate transport system substrate-binding protein